MISNSRKHREKQKLSDKFQQPFETSVKDFVDMFNRKKQKKVIKPIPKKKK